MFCNVKVSAFSCEDSSLRGIGRIFLDDQFVIGNVKLIEGSKGMFISMPDYRTDKVKDGKPVYREICFPVTKEFREKLYDSFSKEYTETIGKKTDKEQPLKKATNKSRPTKAKDKNPEPSLVAAR